MDTRNLEQFASFIEFLANPNEAKKLLVDLIKARDEYVKAVEDLRASKEFQAWRNEQLDFLVAKETQINKLADGNKEAADKKKSQLDAREEKISANEQEVENKKKEVEDKLATLERVDQEVANLVEKQNAFAKVQSDHYAKVAEFDKKAAAFAALLKD